VSAFPLQLQALRRRRRPTSPLALSSLSPLTLSAMSSVSRAHRAVGTHAAPIQVPPRPDWRGSMIPPLKRDCRPGSSLVLFLMTAAGGTGGTDGARVNLEPAPSVFLSFPLLLGLWLAARLRTAQPAHLTGQRGSVTAAWSSAWQPVRLLELGPACGRWLACLSCAAAAACWCSVPRWPCLGL